MKKTLRRPLSLILACVFVLSPFPLFSLPANANAETNELPTIGEDAFFDVHGTKMDRAAIAALTDDGVFISWRFFPEEASGTDGTNPADGHGLTGVNFEIHKNGEYLAGPILNSTNYLDPDGTADDKYVVVATTAAGTTDAASYLNKTQPLTPISGNYLPIPVQQPAPHISPAEEEGVYFMDEMSVFDVDGDGNLEFMVKWLTGNPDVINQGYVGPIILDCYKLDGTLLWRIDLGVNVRAGQHYIQPMLFNFDGSDKAQLMVETAPGSRSAIIDGASNKPTGNWTYIANPSGDGISIDPALLAAAPQTDWAGNKPWTHEDDYRNNDGHVGNIREDGDTFKFMVDFFKNWQGHPEVMEARYGANNDMVKSDKASGGHGWWVYPPQVMLGLYPGDYVGVDGEVPEAGENWTFIEQEDIPGWTQEQHELLLNLPRDPELFKNHVITDDEALALTFLWWAENRRQSEGERWRGSGHIHTGPEFFTVFDAANGRELDTIPYAVPRGIIGPDGSYTPDIGTMWNDMVTRQDEPYNRVNRHLGAVAYLDGADKNPSALQVRGYYSRTTVTRYDWNGTELSATVLNDTGFEVMSNPFAQNNPATGSSNVHGGPGRREASFDPDNPLRPLEWTIADVATANQHGSITCQGQHSMSVMDIDGDGKDEIIIGATILNPDGSVRFAGWYQKYEGNSLVPNGPIEKIGHGDSLHAAYFDPEQGTPKLWLCLEGAWADEILIDMLAGEILYYIGPGDLSEWGGGRDNGRAMAGKFTPEQGWQLITTERNDTPFGEGTGNGLRTSEGAQSEFDLIPITNASIFWDADLTTQTIAGGPDSGVRTINKVNADGTDWDVVLEAAGTRNSGGTKEQPALVADVLGDYREELILGTIDNSEIRIYFNTEESAYKLASLYTDRRYRCEVARQLTCYNQPSYPSFYYGSDMDWAVYAESIGVGTVAAEAPTDDENTQEDATEAMPTVAAEDPVSAEELATAEEAGGDSGPMIAVIIVIVVLLAAGGVVLLIKKKRKLAE